MKKAYASFQHFFEMVKIANTKSSTVDCTITILLRDSRGNCQYIQLQGVNLRLPSAEKQPMTANITLGALLLNAMPFYHELLLPDSSFQSILNDNSTRLVLHAKVFKISFFFFFNWVSSLISHCHSDEVEDTCPNSKDFHHSSFFSLQSLPPLTSSPSSHNLNHLEQFSYFSLTSVISYLRLSIKLFFSEEIISAYFDRHMALLVMTCTTPLIARG